MRYSLRTLAFVAACLGLACGWLGTIALLTVELWARGLKLSPPVAHRLYDFIDKAASGMVIVGFLACVVCLVLGTWWQRLTVAVLLILYLPLIANILPVLWNKLLLL